MKNYLLTPLKSPLLLLVCATLLMACHHEEKEKPVVWADLNLILDTDEAIDSVMVRDIAQSRELHKVAFQDTIRISFNDSINDLYHIWFLKEGKIVSSKLPESQVWLSGKQVIIKGQIDQKLKIDTVIGSDLFYKAREHNTAYMSLIKEKAAPQEIDSFLLKEIDTFIDSPFSLAIMDNYFFRNQEDRDALQKLLNLASKQKEQIKNHSFLGSYERIEKRLGITRLDIDSYKFYDLENKVVTTAFDKDKKYLLDLWFVNCPPCVQEHKLMAQKQTQLKENNIEVIGISRDDDHKIWKEYLTKNNYTWENLRVIDTSKTLIADYDLAIFPTYILVEDGGRIVKTFSSFAENQKYLGLE